MGAPAAWSHATVDAPWGPIQVVATDDAVVAVEQLVPPEVVFARVGRRLGLRTGDDAPASRGPSARLAETAGGQLVEYLAGRRQRFDLPIGLTDRPAWDRAVLDAVAEVPWGAVTSYGRLARRIGRPGSARAVGGAVGRNPVALVVPCHRVLAGDGSLGGYGGDWWGSREVLLEVKRELLRLEGITLPAARLLD